MQTSTQKKSAVVMTRFPYESAWGGEEIHTLTLARYFKDRGYEVIFLGNCPVLLQKFREEGFPTYVVSGGQMVVTPALLLKSFFFFLGWRFLMRWAFKKILKQYDVKGLYCLSLNEKLFLTSLAVKKKIPVTWVEHQEIRAWLLKSPWKWQYAHQARRGVRIVPISKKNQQVLQTSLGLPASVFEEIVNGINLAPFSSVSKERKKGLVVAANRLITKKGLMDFLEAIRWLLVEEKLELEAKIIGEGEEAQQIQLALQTLASEFKGRLTLTPPLPKEQWYQLLSQADVYVSCARDTNETFSLNTAEAMAAGCKVVVTRCSGIADYLSDEKDSFLASPEHPLELAEKIKQALEAPETVRQQARETAQIKFDQQRMLQEYEAFILRTSL